MTEKRKKRSYPKVEKKHNSVKNQEPRNYKTPPHQNRILLDIHIQFEAKELFKNVI